MRVTAGTDGRTGDDTEQKHRMELQYDGTGLHGWARQEGLLTVEGCLHAALTTVLGAAPGLRVAGRTDAGVHARRQVVSLSLPRDIDRARLLRSLNALTPPGIAVTRITRAPAGFDARKDAISRTYRYFLTNAEIVSPFWAPYCRQIHGPLDLQALQAAASLVTGRHDFTAFTPVDTEHAFFNRLVSRCHWRRMREGLPVGASQAFATPAARGAGPDPRLRGRREAGARRVLTAGLVYMEIEAEAFLRHMVRTLVGAMIEVAQGGRTLEDLARLLQGASRSEAGPTAPPQGLFLWDVRYGKRVSHQGLMGSSA